MAYLSDRNLRAVLTVLVSRLGGEVQVTNAELYEAMMPGNGLAEWLLVEETGDGLRVSVQDSYGPTGGSLGA